MKLNRLQILLITSLILILYNSHVSSNNSTAIIGRSLTWDMPNLLLKFSDLAVLPLQLAMTVVDKICSNLLELIKVPRRVTPNIHKMNFMYMTPCGNYSVPLLEAEKLWNHKRFIKSKKVVILATGWTNTVNKSEAIDIMSKAFFCRKDVNFVVVDVAYYVDEFYKWAALNTDLIGIDIAKGLTHLIKVTPLRNIHLVGHSLGAHIMAKAGHEFKKRTGLVIPRITGLDPAKPCFRQTKTHSGLMRGVAKYVDIIHTNIGVLGKRGPDGDIDFYPAGASAIQPGCMGISCSHSRAVAYFAESVYPGQERNFLGYKCNSWKKIKSQNCAKVSQSPMGYVVNQKQKGLFFVDVNSHSPFGKNAPKNLQNIKCNYWCKQ